MALAVTRSVARCRALRNGRAFPQLRRDTPRFSTSFSLGCSIYICAGRNKLCIDPMLREESLLMCDPERDLARADDDMADRYFRLGESDSGTGQKAENGYEAS